MDVAYLNTNRSDSAKDVSVKGTVRFLLVTFGAPAGCAPTTACGDKVLNPIVVLDDGFMLSKPESCRMS